MPNADVFISYKREQRSLIMPIIGHLESLGISVWVDAKLEIGEALDHRINEEVRSAKAVLVCWTPESVASQWVRAEATIGRDRNVLAAVLLAPAQLIPPANLDLIGDLTGWRGDTSHPEWLKVLDRLRHLVGPARAADCAATRFAFEPRKRYDRNPPPRSGERWVEIVAFQAGKATFPPWSRKSSALNAIEWSDYNDFIFTAAEAGGLRCWSDTGRQIARMKIKTRPFNTRAISVDFRRPPLIATAGNGPLCIWRGGGNELLLNARPDFTDSTTVTALAWQPLPDDQHRTPALAASFMLGSQHDNAAICVWNIDTRSTVWSHPCPVSYRLHWSSTGDCLAALSYRGDSFEIFRLNGERLFFKTCDWDDPTHPNRGRSGFAWHPSGRYFATCTSVKEIGIYEIDSLTPVCKLVLEAAHRRESPARSVHWSPDGCHIAIWTAAGTVVIFDANSGLQQAAIYGARIHPYDQPFSPDGQRIAVAGKRGVEFWDPILGAQVATLAPAGDEIGRIRWHPDGQRIAVTHDDVWMKNAGWVQIAKLDF